MSRVILPGVFPFFFPLSCYMFSVLLRQRWVYYHAYLTCKISETAALVVDKKNIKTLNLYDYTMQSKRKCTTQIESHRKRMLVCPLLDGCRGFVADNRGSSSELFNHPEVQYLYLLP